MIAHPLIVFIFFKMGPSILWLNRLDLKPIEQCCNMFTERVDARNHHTRLINDKKSEEQVNILQNEIDQMIKRMLSRCDKCINGRDGKCKLLMCS